ncbi:glutamate-tRNA ligase [Exidia glandulosa HHB12029]|uniref:glutamate--tRNA ligase n=1 Tax=Exidia glandulosa HHB12029 TaxID=1314781 RepID=A0A165ENY5_EXIGL|nr:glutamate-tRNA ligase [Exidia glandulosa HHB12029]
MPGLALALTESPFPYAALALASYLRVPLSFDADKSLEHTDASGAKATGLDAVLDALVKGTNVAGASTKSASFIDIARALATPSTPFPEITKAIDTVDDHLAFRTLLAGHELSVADFAVWGAIKSSSKALGVLKSGQHPHLSRWISYIDGLASTVDALAQLTDAKYNKARSSTTSASFALGLPGAVHGKVVTRFPPEPSGYLHIGHAKAAMLNYFFGKEMYGGKFIVRFDDTNPTKERDEFEQTILEDLEMLGIRGDVITHTSDWFEKLYEYAVEIIKRGKAYCDDTEQVDMRAQRMDGIASKRRDASIEENLARFAEMTKGTTEGKRWCLRAKISVDDPNKAMRDPVIYRCNDMPHHRTGDKWKVYPIYDFACPIVDALEGVTHALRTNEYRDRNPQYQWMLDALGLRKVEVWDFSRLNFVFTLLSKRKLHWFVDQNLVRGWDDPRFPTVRGVRRRGMTVEAIKQYMLLQGPSQSTVALEWDSIWAINKKVIDPIAPRLWAIAKDKAVKVTITNGPKSETKTLPLHKKNPDVGTKQTLFSSTIFVEQEDALSFEDNEEITLMDWGNAFVRKKSVDASGVVTALEMELFLEGDFKKTKKKITWLAQTDFAPVRLLDYDYLITKKSLEENDSLGDFVTPTTEFVVDALTDANVTALKKGDIMQFERKGYYIYDGERDGARDFICIPDGRAASIASKWVTSGATAPSAQKLAGQSWGKGAAASKKTTAGATTGAPAVAENQFAAATTKMYKVDSVYSTETPPKADTKMYEVKSVYAE